MAYNPAPKKSLTNSVHRLRDESSRPITLSAETYLAEEPCREHLRAPEDCAVETTRADVELTPVEPCGWLGGERSDGMTGWWRGGAKSDALKLSGVVFVLVPLKSYV